MHALWPRAAVQRKRCLGASSNVGEWLSLVEHLVRDQGVGGSNPLSPTNLFQNQRLAGTRPSTWFFRRIWCRFCGCGNLNRQFPGATLGGTALQFHSGVPNEQKNKPHSDSRQGLTCY